MYMRLVHRVSANQPAQRDGTCRLRFEGEEEVGKETEVERRLVLEFGGK